MDIILAAVSGQDVIEAVIWLVIVAVIFGVLFWLIEFVGKQFPSIAPFLPVAKIVLAIAAVIVLINLLLSLAGHPLIEWNKP